MNFSDDIIRRKKETEKGRAINIDRYLLLLFYKTIMNILNLMALMA